MEWPGIRLRHTRSRASRGPAERLSELLDVNATQHRVAGEVAGKSIRSVGLTCHWSEISGTSERNGKSINGVWGRRRPRQEVRLSLSFSQIQCQVCSSSPRGGGVVPFETSDPPGDVVLISAPCWPPPVATLGLSLAVPFSWGPW